MADSATKFREEPNHFSSCSHMPTHYAQYLPGHSTGRAAIVRYTHLNALRERYEEAVQRQFGPLVRAVSERSRELGLM